MAIASQMAVMGTAERVFLLTGAQLVSLFTPLEHTLHLRTWGDKERLFTKPMCIGCFAR